VRVSGPDIRHRIDKAYRTCPAILEGEVRLLHKGCAVLAVLVFLARRIRQYNTPHQFSTRSSTRRHPRAIRVKPSAATTKGEIRVIDDVASLHG
jgi:hypothetical protein